MLIGENKALKQFAYFFLTKSSIQRTFSFFEEIMNAPQSIVSTASTTSQTSIWYKAMENFYGLF